MFRLGGAEWIIILVIVLLLFGPGRIGKIAGELGRSIKDFREAPRTIRPKNLRVRKRKSNI
jgi:sec-independent protein translocase protein TatA